MIHKESHPLAGKTVKIQRGQHQGLDFHVEDYWDRVFGASWKFAKGNPACMIYAMRTGFKDQFVPADDEVLYGKIGSLGSLIHVKEIEEVC